MRMPLTTLGCCIVLLAVGGRCGHAQQTPPPPEMQALSAKLVGEINVGLQCSSALITAQQQLEQARAEVKRLKDKYEAEQK